MIFLTAIFGHLTKLIKKSLPFLWSGQSWLQSEMFLSNSEKLKKVVFISLCPKLTRIKTNLKNQEHQLRLQRPLSKKKPWPKKLHIFLLQATKILLDCGFPVLIRSGVCFDLISYNWKFSVAFKSAPPDLPDGRFHPEISIFLHLNWPRFKSPYVVAGISFCIFFFFSGTWDYLFKKILMWHHVFSNFLLDIYGT